ncbi:7809_t:CDS:2 [Ambispora gerdemannii]|uniref:7809_t:CDS:1 n=1 Tax=Ambispora gerdemannii TaxID=144530 RepID=A0A9N8VWW4_9GLOM|nr:7809_t:CDS:2 [Ambispora gerdemannii]
MIHYTYPQKIQLLRKLKFRKTLQLLRKFSSSSSFSTSSEIKEVRLLYGTWQDPFCVCYKPPGMAVQDNNPSRVSLVRTIKNLCGRQAFTGPLVLAFEKEIARILSDTLANGLWQKWYRALVKIPLDVTRPPRQSLYQQGSLIAPNGQLVKHGKITSWIKRCPPIIRPNFSPRQPWTDLVPDLSEITFRIPSPAPKNHPSHPAPPINPLNLTVINFYKQKLTFDLVQTQLENAYFFHSAPPFCPATKLSITEFWLRDVFSLADYSDTTNNNNQNYRNEDNNSSSPNHKDKVGAGYDYDYDHNSSRRHQKIGLYDIYLHTGRTHQIRLHFAESGCPILGDEVYEDLIGKRKQYNENKYLALQAYKLRLPHPWKRWEWIECEVNMPNDKEWLKNINFNNSNN